MQASGATGPRGRSGAYLAVIAAALIVTLYLILQLIGFLLKLLFLAAAVVIALVAWQAWGGAD
jgi:hypothetical protein